jgi:hypothetical protein
VFLLLMSPIADVNLMEPFNQAMSDNVLLQVFDVGFTALQDFALQLLQSRLHNFCRHLPNEGF